ncbi:hypothetical protein IKE98_01460 [Candidatus Saccharibacteria bacterium]|nr:hypothetical protein [Candidatus Saccharibacteria bacterium]
MKKIVAGIMMVCMALVVTVAPVYADDGGCVPTSVLGGSKCKYNEKTKEYTKSENGEYNCSCDDGKGSSVTAQLNLVVDIMTIGIGILGVIGITIVGIQYLTAGGSEEKTRKAKRRMFEIVIGLVAYVVLYAFVKWLIPTS